MRALTLRQPWASLVALGVKRIETRSWSTKYRGRIAIHAGATLAEHPATFGEFRVWRESGVVTWLDARGGDPASDRYWPMPLGAVVATANLVDCLPMVEHVGRSPADARYVQPLNGGEWWICGPDPYGRPSRMTEREITDQVPFGDFAAGRWAWLLEDVAATTERCPECWNQFEGRMPGHVYGSNWAWVPCRTCDGDGKCDPVPAKGRQGLWSWDPSSSLRR